MPSFEEIARHPPKADLTAKGLDPSEGGRRLPAAATVALAVTVSGTGLVGNVAESVMATTYETWFHQLHTYYAEQEQELPTIAIEPEKVKDFLKELFIELKNTLADPKKLAPILAEVVVVSPGLYLCWQMVKKMKEFATKKDNSLIGQIASECAKILRYFEEVPKSRIKEISSATGISTKKLYLLLKLLSFDHEPNCFWQPPTGKLSK